MRLGSILIFLALSACAAQGQLLRVVGLAPATRSEALAERIAAQNRGAYSLPPDKLRKAAALHGIDESLTVAGSCWSILQLLLLLKLGIVARTRDSALRLSRYRVVQGYGFVFLMLLLTGLLDLPLAMYGHHVGLAYGLSVQGWASWFGDKARLFAVEWLIGGGIAVLLLWAMRRSPGRWWFRVWIPAAGVVVAGIFVAPYVIDPLFNKFEPLAQSDPALVAQLERVVARTGSSIAPDRMFLMRASAKYTGLNAYVTGFGASKRIVVWDTTIARATPDEIAMVFAHEMGHYALGHVVDGVVMTCAALLPFFWLGYHGVRLLLWRYGDVWGIESQQDWGALVVLALVLSVVSLASEPFGNAVSRLIEHNADVYGQEAVHGIVSDPQAVGREAFQVLGEQSLDDPEPHPLFDFWFGTHPPIGFRAAFAQAYDPWAPRQHPKYFAR